jgi:hypothetical protein
MSQPSFVHTQYRGHLYIARLEKGVSLHGIGSPTFGVDTNAAVSGLNDTTRNANEFRTLANVLLRVVCIEEIEILRYISLWRVLGNGCKQRSVLCIIISSFHEP